MFSNRCSAISNAAHAVFRAMAHAKKIGHPSRVYLTAAWATNSSTPDNCVIFTSSGGYGGDTTQPTTINTRPPWAGGPNQSQCLAFWNSLAS